MQNIFNLTNQCYKELTEFIELAVIMHSKTKSFLPDENSVYSKRGLKDYTKLHKVAFYHLLLDS